MAGKGRLVLGVDMNASEICIVGMRGTWANAQVVCAGSTPMPAGAIEGSAITDPVAVSEALRKLLSLINTGTRDVVFGMSGRNVLTRALDIPNVPDNELRTVIQGELVHYQILRDTTGAFDYMRLHKPEDAPEAGPQALVMAAEDAVVHNYRTVAEMAGVQLIALEPVLPAMYRVAFARVQSQEAALCLALSGGEVEISVISHGEIRLYRRVDMGRSLLGAGPMAAARSSKANARPGVFLLNTEEEEADAPEEAPTAPDRQINIAAASSLVLEIQRSLDYYTSQYPQFGTVGCAVVATNEPEMEPLAAWLGQALSFETTLAELPAAKDAPPAVAAQLTGPDKLRFLGAIGLAMHALTDQPKTVPCFNLSNLQSVQRARPTGSRARIVSLAACGLFLLLGVGLGVMLGRQAGDLAHTLEQRQAELKSKQKYKQEVVDAIQAQITQLTLLQPKGMPFPRVMDAVANSVAPEIGLTGIDLDKDGKLLVTGEAGNEKAIIRMLETLKNNPYFDSTSLDAFDRKTGAPNRAPVVTFQISAHLAGMSHPTPTTASAH